MLFYVYFHRIVILLGVFVLLTANTVMAQHSRSLSVGWSIWPPYQYLDDKENITGLDIDLLKEIADIMGYSLTFQQLPWVRCLLHVERGLTDMTCGASKTEERLVYALFSNPFRPESFVMYVRAGESERYPFKSLSDMIGTKFRLGVIIGYYYGDLYEELIKKPEFKAIIQDVNDDSTNFKKIVNDRIDGFLIDPIVGKNIIDKQRLQDKLEIHPMPVFSSDVFVMFSKETVSQEVVDQFNQGLIKIKETGVYDEIFKRYAP